MFVHALASGKDIQMIAKRAVGRVSLHGYSALALLAFGLHCEAAAQSYPSNTIRIVATTSPGSPPDVISRVIASELAETEGWRVVVENRPGALTTLAMAHVLKQPADGYSIFPMSMPTMVIPSLLPRANLRPDTDLHQLSRLQRRTRRWSQRRPLPSNRSANSLYFSRVNLTSSIFPSASLVRHRTSSARCLS